MNQKRPNTVRIQLTAEQRAKIQQLTGKDAQELEFTAEELEQRIAPGWSN